MCLPVERIRMRRRWPAENAAQEADGRCTGGGGQCRCGGRGPRKSCLIIGIFIVIAPFILDYVVSRLSILVIKAFF
jgi:hypothetical protein